MALLIFGNATAQTRDPEKYSVEVTARPQTAPPQIQLQWLPGTNALSYEIRRKRLRDSAWDAPRFLSGQTSAFTDSRAAIGDAFEYQLIRRTESTNTTGYGYIYAGIQVPLTDHRGKILLLVEENAANALRPELVELQSDLTGDGWTVVRHDIPAGMTPPNVKSIIQTDYAADANEVKSVLLFGHIAVPYSGDIWPDGHPNHRGAWPADVYYGQMTANWTDDTVTSTNAERLANWNIPGDGKFDQSVLTEAVQLAVGRVDLSNLTDFANKNPSRSEIDLLRAYLAKDHAFRQGQLAVPRRALVCDNFYDKGDDPIGGSAWRNFVPYVGRGQIVKAGWLEYLPHATAEAYLCSYASGGGSYTYSEGVATADDFALQDVKVIFTEFCGSYFGDWNNESNYLRSALGSGYVLTAVYAGFPQFIAHPMALGLTIGDAIRLTQNNHEQGLYPPYNKGTAGRVHISLLGDPTLRLDPVLPPTGLQARETAGGLLLTWSASLDQAIVGYHIYRASSMDGPFQRISTEPVPGNQFADAPGAGHWAYMVRAIKLETSSSGSYDNASQGVFAEGDASPATPQPVRILFAGFRRGLFDVRVDNPNAGATVLEAADQLGQWAALGTNSAANGTAEFFDRPSAHRFYRARWVP